ncbi:MAG TPA: CGNR zinc finger domain-containing protein [Roseiflexaceae bacterium]|jgi:predicted RNA-binding Zn ribbon-like protein|nr:CGNR zinc finger domain-containing protein [Roseiflexaceae bacterium]
MRHYKESELLAERIVNTCDTTRAEPEYLRTPVDLAQYVRTWNIPLRQQPTAQDLAAVLDLRRRLRAVFEAGDMAVAVALLNELLHDVRVRPYVALDQDGGITLQLAVGEDLPLARRLAAEAALGLSAALEQYGIERFHVCNATPCTDVFIDTSRNHTRRYCCEQCANRHNVAAHRRRQKPA